MTMTMHSSNLDCIADDGEKVSLVVIKTKVSHDGDCKIDDEGDRSEGTYHIK